MLGIPRIIAGEEIGCCGISYSLHIYIYICVCGGEVNFELHLL